MAKAPVKVAKDERIEKLMGKILAKHGSFSEIPMGSAYWVLRRDLAKLRNNDVSDDNALETTDDKLTELESKHD